jgi:hypothetical protein
MSPSGRGKLLVPYRSPDGEHCSFGCKWFLRNPSSRGPECCLFGPIAREYDVRTGARRLLRSRSCRKYDSRRGRPTIVCLCGSTRFYAAFQKAYFEESMRGKIVLSVGFAPGIADGEHNEKAGGITPRQKILLDELHMQKIDMADEILVLNVDGYVGESTSREIEHARRRGKTIRWLTNR